LAKTRRWEKAVTRRAAQRNAGDHSVGIAYARYGRGRGSPIDGAGDVGRRAVRIGSCSRQVGRLPIGDGGRCGGDGDGRQHGRGHAQGGRVGILSAQRGRHGGATQRQPVAMPLALTVATALSAGNPGD